jgi:hypothetical protein
VGEAAPSFHHLHDTTLDQVVGGQPFDLLSAVLDRPLGDFTALTVQEV